jgi:ATP-binding cassette, subfamily F, member 3
VRADGAAADPALFLTVSMLIARDLDLRRGPQPLFEQVNFTVFRGNKAGITGANGTGKSSLFAAILRQLAPDRGDIDVPAGLKTAHVEQEVAASERPAIEFVLDGDEELRTVQAAIEDAERRDAAMALAELYSALEAIDGYRAKARAAAIMHGLGFKAADHERTVAEFSGGWRVRLSMARALCSRADLLLLDEPTNHLDLDAIVWLEEWLTAYPGTLLMISHDREFLDAIIDRVLHIENRTIRSYTGNYSQFEQKRSEELALLSVLHARQVKRIAEITSFVNRFRASATKSRQAQSRLKMLERMERIVPAHVDSPFEFQFARPAKTPRPLISLEQAACGYTGARGTVQIVGGINVSIGPLDRIALLGPNGAGKSTLTKLLAGESLILEGRRTAAPDLAIGYFAQQQMEQLKSDCDAFWHLRHRGGADYAAGDEQKIRDHLGSFGFQGDRAFEPVGRFSGGEKARLTLALLVARRPNLLLLDEPTNHLDIDMRQALGIALQSFEGGLVVVSHDRHLIKSVADTLWLVADGKLQEFAGDLDDYQQWLRSRGKTPQSATTSPQKASAKTPAAKTPADRKAPRRDPLVRLRQQLEQVEGQIAAVTAERALLEAEFAGHPNDRLAARRANLQRDAAYLESQWMQIGTAIEVEEAKMAQAQTGI